MKNAIVAAIDFSSMTATILEQAAKEARLRPGATLHLVHVLPPPIAAPVAFSPATLDMTAALGVARDELQRAARGADLAGIHVVGHVRIGAAVDEICAVAEEVDAEIVVVGATTKGFAMRALLGSTTTPLMTRAPCSVLIARVPSVPAIEPRRADQNDDVHRRHHPAAHAYTEKYERLGHEGEAFRFGIQT